MMQSYRPASEPGSTQALLACMRRLEELVDQETAALVEHRPVDMEEVNRRKSRALLELTRIARAAPTASPESGVRQGIARLRAKLMRNRDLLNVHVAAVREVGDILARVISDGESDGTYTARAGLSTQ